MKTRYALVPLLLAAMYACAPHETKGGSPGESTSSSGNPIPATSGPPPSCTTTCQSAADCAGQEGGPLTDASHFACNAGRCQWLGCTSTAECSSALKSNRVVCEKPAGAPVADCVPTCQSAADCAGGGAGPLADASHFTCTGGRCQWLGCTSTAECSSALKSNRVVCEKPAGAPVADCVPTCQSAADCANPAAPLADASHFACNAGRCQWLGCSSTSECTSALKTNRVVCE